MATKKKATAQPKLKIKDLKAKKNPKGGILSTQAIFSKESAMPTLSNKALTISSSTSIKL